MPELPKKEERSTIITPGQMSAEACMREVNEVLARYKLVLVPIFNFDGTTLNATIGLKDNPKAPKQLIGGYK